ncbi:MAG TPA: hypothetical protein VEK57_18350 [Thermoanaerobaculia bacterium]|nr:hypothetical protein [Thermoanaerobaculia bacterium]
MRPFTLLFVALLTAGCGSGGGSLVTGDTSHASTEDFQVLISQTNTPMVMRGQTSTDVLFEIDVKNRTDKPWNIEKIALQSMSGGSYRVPVSTRKYERTIAPGQEEKFEFWVTIDFDDEILGARPAMVMRAKLYAEADGVKRQEEFTGSVNGRLTVGGVGR